MDYECMIAQQRMHASQMAADVKLGGALSAGNSVRPTDFNDLLARIRSTTVVALEAAAHSNSIATVIHGHRNEVSENEAAPVRDGLIGQYEDALDELSSALIDVRNNLRRISNGIPDKPNLNLAEAQRRA